MAKSTWKPIATEYDPLKAGSIDGTDTIPHDHGVVRAMKAVYKPNKLVVGNPKATLFVGRLNPSTQEDTLREIFSRYGEIKRMRLVRDIITGFSKGYAFIEYEDRQDVKEAIKGLNHTVIDNNIILVDTECERTLPGWIPRRLGGGLSGKKESGQLRFGGCERPFKKPLLPPSNPAERKHKVDQNTYLDKPHFKERRNYSDRNYSERKYDSHRTNRDRYYSRDRHYSRHDSERYERDGKEDRRSSRYDSERYERDYKDDRHSSRYDSERYERDGKDDRRSSRYDSD